MIQIKHPVVAFFRFVFVASLLLTLPAVSSEEIKTTLEDQTAVSITIYNENLALVKDQRNVTLPLGNTSLAFSEVSALIRPETALLSSESGSQLRLIEQNFDYDLLTPTKLLDKYVGRRIGVIRTNPASGEEITEEATVLSTNDGVVLQYADRIETGMTGRFVFSSVPENLRDQPTLVMQLKNSQGAKQAVELSYLTGGLSWKADYVALLNNDETRLNINGWMTLNNQSGADYRDALLQLVAGDVQQVQDQRVSVRKNARVLEMAATSVADFAEESLLDYHLYTLDRPTTILNKQRKQVALLSAASVPGEKHYLLNGFGHLYDSRYQGAPMKEKVGVYLSFQNSESSQLGLPLPKGVVRVYKADSNGRTQFVGEDRIDHTAKDQPVKLKLGNAFDVTATRLQTDFRVLKKQVDGRYAVEVEQEITLDNAKSTDVQVTVREPIPGDWTILEESQVHQKVASNSVEWLVTVPANGRAMITYRTKVVF